MACKLAGIRCPLLLKHSRQVIFLLPTVKVGTTTCGFKPAKCIRQMEGHIKWSREECTESFKTAVIKRLFFEIRLNSTINLRIVSPFEFCSGKATDVHERTKIFVPIASHDEPSSER